MVVSCQLMVVSGQLMVVSGQPMVVLGQFVMVKNSDIKFGDLCFKIVFCYWFFFSKYDIYLAYWYQSLNRFGGCCKRSWALPAEDAVYTEEKDRTWKQADTCGSWQLQGISL